MGLPRARHDHRPASTSPMRPSPGAASNTVALVELEILGAQTRRPAGDPVSQCVKRHLLHASCAPESASPAAGGSIQMESAAGALRRNEAVEDHQAAGRSARYSAGLR